MRTATSIQEEASTLTPAQMAEMRRMDPNGDGVIDEKEGRAIARSSAKLRASNSRLWKVVFGVVALLVLSWMGNAGLMVAVVTLSKDLKVEGVSLKTVNGGSVSTHGQKNVFEVTLTAGRRLEEQSGGNIQEPVAQVICENVLLAISSIENGDDESLVKITLGDGIFWEPRMSAASYHLHESSFGVDQVYLRDQPDGDVFYDANCEMSKEACETNPSTPCGVLPSAATAPRALSSFEDAFDGDVRRRLTHAVFNHKTAQGCADSGCFDHCPIPAAQTCDSNTIGCPCGCGTVIQSRYEKAERYCDRTGLAPGLSSRPAVPSPTAPNPGANPCSGWECQIG